MPEVTENQQASAFKILATILKMHHNFSFCMRAFPSVGAKVDAKLCKNEIKSECEGDLK